MSFGDKGCDPAHVEVLAARAGRSCEALLDVALDRRFPKAAVARVDRELVRRLRNADVRVRQQELAQLVRRAAEALTAGA